MVSSETASDSERACSSCIIMAWETVLSVLSKKVACKQNAWNGTQEIQHYSSFEKNEFIMLYLTSWGSNEDFRELLHIQKTQQQQDHCQWGIGEE